MTQLWIKLKAQLTMFNAILRMSEVLRLVNVLVQVLFVDYPTNPLSKKENSFKPD